MVKKLKELTFEEANAICENTEDCETCPLGNFMWNGNCIINSGSNLNVFLIKVGNKMIEFGGAEIEEVPSDGNGKNNQGEITW